MDLSGGEAHCIYNTFSRRKDRNAPMKSCIYCFRNLIGFVSEVGDLYCAKTIDLEGHTIERAHVKKTNQKARISIRMLIALS